MENLVGAFKDDLGAKYSASRNTIRVYGGHLRRLADHLRNLGVSLTDATQEHLQEYLDRLQTLPLSKHTIGRQISAFRAFYAFAEQRGLRRGNPTAGLEVPSYRKRLPTPADDSESEMLAASTGTKTLWNMRDRLAIEIIKSTGIRPFELVALNIEDVNLADGTIRLAGPASKKRTFALSPPLIKDLTEYLAMIGGGAGPLIINRFRKRTTTRTVDRIFAKYAKATNTAIIPRSLRHATAFKTVEQGKPEEVEESLGFTNPKSAAYYVRSIQRVRRGEKTPPEETISENTHQQSPKYPRGRPRRLFPTVPE